jgi:cysteine desulfurase
MNNSPVYLDWNATAPLREEARAAMLHVMDSTGNASSVHRSGRRARAVVEDARNKVAALVGASPSGVIFTGSGTEANHLALAAFAGPLAVSAVEHASVRAVRSDAVELKVDSQGLVYLDDLETALDRLPKPALVSVQLANNETGVVQPIAEIAAIVHAHGSYVHADGVQIAGRAPISLAGTGIDFLSLSAHKLGGAQGVGALVIGPEVDVKPMLRGGGQERGRRAGTENVAGIAAFGAAAHAARRDFSAWSKLTALRDRFESRLLEAAGDVLIAGYGAPRLPNTSCIAMPGVEAATQVMAFDLDGFAVSAGAACSSGKVQASPVLAAMGWHQDAASRAIRVSIGPTTTAEDLDCFAEAWIKLFARTGARRRAA